MQTSTYDVLYDSYCCQLLNEATVAFAVGEIVWTLLSVKIHFVKAQAMFGRFIFSKKYHYKVDNNYISLQGRQTANVVNIVQPETFAGILIWWIGNFFTKLPKLFPPNMWVHAQERDTRNHVHNSAQQGCVRRTCIRQIKICQ